MWWNDVELVKPNDGEIVDVITNCKDYKLNNNRWTDVTYKNGEWYSTYFSGFKVEGVTHWMYPPGEESLNA